VNLICSAIKNSGYGLEVHLRRIWNSTGIPDRAAVMEVISTF
jgi:hypothetical protein